MSVKVWLSILILAISVGGCAYQYRTTGAQISSTQLINLYNEIESGGAIASSNGNNGSLAATSSSPTTNQGLLNTDPTAIAFYVGDDPSRPVNSVLAFDNMSVLSSNFTCQDSSLAYVECSGLAHVQVIFVDGYNVDNNGNPVRSFELLMKLTDSANNVYYSAWQSVPGSDDWSGGLFSVDMTPVSGTGQPLVLETTDIDSSQDFNSAIKLQVLVGNGQSAQYAGQISTMTGFD